MKKPKEEKHLITIFLNNFLMAAIGAFVVMIVLGTWLPNSPEHPVIFWLVVSVLSAWISTIFKLRRMIREDKQNNKVHNTL